MGKSTINGHFQLQTVSSPEGKWRHNMITACVSLPRCQLHGWGSSQCRPGRCALDRCPPASTSTVTWPDGPPTRPTGSGAERRNSWWSGFSNPSWVWTWKRKIITSDQEVVWSPKAGKTIMAHQQICMSSEDSKVDFGVTKFSPGPFLASCFWKATSSRSLNHKKGHWTTSKGSLWRTWYICLYRYTMV